MGGLWCDFDQMTNIPGLFAGGEAEYQYHGANRLGANSLMSCLYAGMVLGPQIKKYIGNLPSSAAEVDEKHFEAARKLEEDDLTSISGMSGEENAHKLWLELGMEMTRNVTIVRYNKDLEETYGRLNELQERWNGLDVLDSSRTYNTSILFAKQLRDMFHLAKAITASALNRNESRGAHYKPEFPDRNDDEWMKTTLATYTSDGPKLDYEDVEVGLIKPRPRRYATV